jgi:hypothetical protein
MSSSSPLAHGALHWPRHAAAGGQISVLHVHHASSSQQVTAAKELQLQVLRAPGGVTTVRGSIPLTSACVRTAWRLVRRAQVACACMRELACTQDVTLPGVATSQPMPTCCTCSVPAATPAPYLCPVLIPQLLLPHVLAVTCSLPPGSGHLLAQGLRLRCRRIELRPQCIHLQAASSASCVIQLHHHPQSTLRTCKCPAPSAPGLIWGCRQARRQVGGHPPGCPTQWPPPPSSGPAPAAAPAAPAPLQP